MSSGRRAVALRPGQLLAVGGMLFSMFFGAGNLILPPLLGLQAGDQAIPAMTGFLIAGIGLPVLGIVVAANVRELGVSDPKRVAGSISGAGLIAGALMMAIYCGLAFVGSAMGSTMPDAANGASILAASASAHFGPAGTVIVAAIFLLACLNVCTGLISCCSEYFSEAFPRIPLPAWAAAFAAFSCAVSLVGLDAILAFSAPLLGALYPPAIVLVVMGLAHGRCDRLPRMWPCAVLATAAFSVAVGLRDAFAPGAWLPLDALPLADAGLGWLVVAIAGAAAGAIWSLAERRRRARRA